MTAIDPLSGASLPLFNPRSDVWVDHFQWPDREPSVLQGKTACGRATIALLRINNPDMVAIRQLLAAVGLFTEILGSDS